jgi:hypothetical protein
MKLNLAKELAALKQMTVGQLQQQYVEVFGEPVRSRHKQYLIRRIAWRLQANAEGGLSERALRRSYARNATRQHLQISQGRSVVHGHTHRADASIIQNIWSPGKVVQARSAGRLCKPVPLYGTERPVEWINAFILGYLGRRSDTLYTIPIMDKRCILPDGTEVAA